ncbi:uncharacterized protein L201_001060 [Kwoniella dendrophila CBS 6074]|uniref:RING-type domain-containing protein n=1 Tax=Kwoniella dendrophila CBS 6074 TaxID=1295534 RepID=A0AAX4JMZ2_9TREE
MSSPSNDRNNNANNNDTTNNSNAETSQNDEAPSQRTFGQPSSSSRSDSPPFTLPFPINVTGPSASRPLPALAPSVISSIFNSLNPSSATNTPPSDSPNPLPIPTSLPPNTSEPPTVEGSTSPASQSTIRAAGAPGGPPVTTFWSFTINPNSDVNFGPPSTHRPLANGDGNSPNTSTTTTNNEGGTQQQPQQAPQRAPPPWIFPPFFNFFMPIRTEPQPNPEKATELLRSLPDVGRSLLMRVDKIIAAQEHDDVIEEEKGWKCGICLEGFDLDSEDVGDEHLDEAKDKEETGEMKKNEEEEQQQNNEDKHKDKRIKLDNNRFESTEEEKKEKENQQKIEEKSKTNNTGVKALPCNHLFHETCLHPWFTTKHTCPSCRLDLDPLQTLNSPSTNTSNLRPAQTGSGGGRRSPHPYARPPNSSTTNNDTSQQESDNQHGPLAGSEGLRRLFQPGGAMFPSVGISGNGNPEEDNGPTITFIFSGSPPAGFNLPGLPPRSNPTQQGNGSATPANPTDSANSDRVEPTVASATANEATEASNTTEPVPPAPSTPGSIFDVPTFFSSPLPMASRASPGPSVEVPLPVSSNVPTSSSASQSDQFATTVSAPPHTDTPSNTPQQEGSSTESPAINTDDRPRPERRPHITIIRTSSPSRSPAPGPDSLPPLGGPPGASSLGLGLGNLPLPPFLFPNMTSRIFNPEQNSPTLLPDQVSTDNGTAPSVNTDQPSISQPQPASEPSSTPTTAPFVPQSLESWAEEKERILGWRCDAPECVYAPSTKENEDTDKVGITDRKGKGKLKEPLSEEEYRHGREMFSLDHSHVQTALSDHNTILKTKLKTETETETETETKVEGTPKPHKVYTATICPHKWHRKCLELSQKSLGRSTKIDDRDNGNNDDAERIWMNCDKCKTEGWTQSASVLKNNNNEEMKVGNAIHGVEKEEEEGYAASEMEVENLMTCDNES